MLVCDDEASTRFVIRSLASKYLGWTVEECAGGAEALTRLGQVAFDIVILDIEMPEVNGVDVLEVIRRTPSLQHLPVVMLSSHRDAEMVLRVKHFGIADYILKPFGKDHVLDRLRNVPIPLRARA
jgi:two-component system chemotaxis response regulator CheY